jgi:hypothetical protein
VETLAARIREEAVAKKAVLVLRPVIDARAYTPAVGSGMAVDARPPLRATAPASG